jgi:cytidylate kinase
VFLGDEEVTAAIREPAVDREVSAVSALPAVRRFLVRWQRRRAAQGNVVLEGRDTGTVVWPNADVKIYLEASLSERAARRARQAGSSSGANDWAADLARRDRADSERVHSPLRKPDDAVAVDTTPLSIEEQVERVHSICVVKLSARRRA